VPKTALNHLNVLHKLIRAMNFASYRSHVTPLYHQSNLLKINYIYHLEIAKMMHCLHNGKLPQTFDDYFVPVSSVHTHLTSKATHGKYFLHSISSEHGKRSIRYHGPSFRIQLIIHCSDYLLFCSENVIEPNLSHRIWKTQNSRYSFHSFLKV